MPPMPSTFDLPGRCSCVSVLFVVKGDAHLGRLARFKPWVLHYYCLSRYPVQPWIHLAYWALPRISAMKSGSVRCGTTLDDVSVGPDDDVAGAN